MLRLALLFGFSVAVSGCVHLAADVATNDFRPSPTPDPALATPSIEAQNAAWCEVNDCSQSIDHKVEVLMDTHAHLSMGPGMGFVFTGTPWELEYEPHWSHRFSEKMPVEKLRESGYGLIVVSLYVNVFAIWPKDPMTAIFEEIEQTRELVRRYPETFALVTTSEQARRAIAEGKIALVMHLEGAEWGMRSEEDIVALYNAGVRGTNPIHLYDSWIGGADLQAGARWFLNPPGWGASREVNGRRENSRGLTPQGKTFLVTLRDYGIMIDISHFSRQALRELHEMPSLARTPLFNSHMPDLDTTTYSERGVDDEAFHILRAHHGLLGLVPTAHSPENMELFPGLCPGTVETYAGIYAEAVRRGKGLPIGIASDFNGGIGHLMPTHGPEGCREGEAPNDFAVDGLAHTGHIPSMVAEIEARGHSVQPLYDASERFLEAWELAERLKRR